MKAQQTYLKGRSVFLISLLVIAVTIVTVYLTGININRSLSSNFYISAGIISASLFLFMTYGLFYGIGLKDNFPRFKSFNRGEFIAQSGIVPNMPDVDAGEGIAGIIVSILLWILMSIVFVVLLIVLEAALWFTFFIIIAMLYWLFFRALRLVFSKSAVTKNNLGLSIVYALAYTAAYTGWIFAIVFITETFK
ncbi:hypothetical protein [Carboxylicivirga sp. RSCT41]|uniref:hypothetical protein n=1 Tax=Carboxylicivirga agarovorans TaxID=3417570 RepID=UPI003D349656